MNVLLLTPDGVGSTMLQRLITIYMQFHDFDKPVINLHELTNGLEKYYSPDFNMEIVSKKKVLNWGYYQSLEAVVQLLSSTDHYKVSRLAHYHLRMRRDEIAQQIPFYQYLNDNFFVIGCRRHNLFEHALSMVLRQITKKNNVYDVKEKYHAFWSIYKNPIQINPRAMITVLDSYKDYIEWSKNHFNISSYFYYDEHLEQIEKYILSLPFLQKTTGQLTWQNVFGIDLDAWNRCHNISGDIGSLFLEHAQQVLKLEQELASSCSVEGYQKHAPIDWPAIQDQADFDRLPIETKAALEQMLPSTHMLNQYYSPAKQRYANYYWKKYTDVQESIKKMIELDIIVSGPPIKKNTLEEKKFIVKNFDQCLEAYNDWVDHNQNIAEPIDATKLQQMIDKEKKFYNDFTTLTSVSTDQSTTQKLSYQNDAHHAHDPVVDTIKHQL